MLHVELQTLSVRINGLKIQIFSPHFRITTELMQNENTTKKVLFSIKFNFKKQDEPAKPRYEFFPR